MVAALTYPVRHQLTSQGYSAHRPGTSTSILQRCRSHRSRHWVPASRAIVGSYTVFARPVVTRAITITLGTCRRNCGRKSTIPITIGIRVLKKHASAFMIFEISAVCIARFLTLVFLVYVRVIASAQPPRRVGICVRELVLSTCIIRHILELDGL